MFKVKTFADVERAKQILIGDHRGSKGEFASLLCYTSYGTIAVWKRRKKVPAIAAARIEELVALSAGQLSDLKGLRLHAVD